MNTLRGRSTGYLLASLLAVTIAWWGCSGSTGDGEGGSTETPPATTSEAEGTDEGDGGAAEGEVSVAAGGQVYSQRCALCHGETGKGDGPAGQALDPKPRDHSDKTYMGTLSDDDIMTVILSGKGAMPPHKGILSDSELESVLLFVRSLSQS